MFNFKLKTHRLNQSYAQPHFFILNKGNNSGKPLNVPCPNCFVCLCENEEEKEMLFWLLLGMCQGRAFEPLLCGSVIPFIKIKDVKNTMLQLSKNHAAQIANYQKKVLAIQNIQKAKTGILQQLQTLQTLQKVMVADLVKA